MKKLFLLTVFLCLNVATTAQADTPQADAKASKADKGTKAGKLNKISGVDIDQRDGKTFIRVKGAGEPTYSVFKLHSPLRLFVDISNSQLAEGVRRAPVSIQNGTINQIALLDFADNVQQITRVIIGFDVKAAYDVQTKGDDIIIVIDSAAGPAKTSQGPVASNAGTAELERARKALREKERRLMEVENKVAGLERALADGGGKGQEVIQGALDAERKKAQSLRQELSGREKELRRLQASVKTMENTLGAVRSEAADTINKLKAEVGRLREEQAASQKRAASLQAERDQAKQRAESLATERDKARASATELEAKVAKARKDVSSVEAELSKAQGELAQVRDARKAALDKTTDLRNQIDALRKQSDGLALKAEASRKNLAKLEGDKAGADKIKAEKDALAALDAQVKDVNGKLAAREQDLDQAIARARTLDEAKTKAATAAQRVAERRDAGMARVQQAEEGRLKALDQARAKEQERLKAVELARKAEEKRLDELAKARKVEETQLAKAKEARKTEEKARKAEEAKLAETRQARQAEEAKLAKMRAAGTMDGSTVDMDGVKKLNVIKSIRFQQKSDVSQIVVQLDRPSNFRTVPWRNGKAELVMSGVELPKKLERSLDTRAFGGTVHFVNSFQDDKGTVHIEAEIPGASMELVHQDGESLVWEFSRPGEGNSIPAVTAQTGAPPAGANLPSPSGFTAQPPAFNAPSAAPSAADRNTPPWWRRPKGMSLKRIDIDLRAADIANVMRLLAKEGGVNIVYGASSSSNASLRSGQVTMRLNNVPLADAFIGILKSQQLGYDQTNEVIRVAPIEIFEREAAQRRTALLESFPLEPLDVVLIPVNYADATTVQPIVQTLLSERGSINVDERTNTLVIKDIGDNIGAVQQLVMSLDTQTPQVLIESRIVETNDRYVRELGIQWGGEFLYSAANGNNTGLVFPSTIGVRGAATDQQTPTNGMPGVPNFAVNLPAPIGTGAGGGIGVTLGSLGGNASLGLRLSALEENGHLKIISSPKILTLDNRPARISQGTSIPISVVSAQGVQTQFVEARLELSVEPHITQDGNILMQLQITKSEPDFENTGARGDPTIIRKEAETELLIADGDTTVIGGIYSKTTGRAQSKVPWLGDIPVLGFFFRDYSESEARTELLIFVTPRIVNREAAIAARRLSPIRSSPAGAQQRATGK